MVNRLPTKLRKPKARYHHGDLREAALTAAAEEIDAHGHVAFTMERVGKRLGVTPAALYRHYKNRDDLLREVTWQIFQRYAQTVDAAALGDSGDPLAAIGRAYVRFAVANPGWFRLQFSIAGSTLSDRQATAQTKYAEVMQRELGVLFGGDEAQVAKWLMAMWALVHGASSMAVEHVIPPLTSDEQRIALADEQVTTFLDGVRAAAQKHKRAAAK